MHVRSLLAVVLAFGVVLGCSDGGTPPPNVVPCIPGDEDAPPLRLTRGDVRFLTPAAGLDCVQLATDSTAGTYLFITGHTSTTRDQVDSIVVATQTAAAVVPSAALARTAALSANPDANVFGALFEERLRQLEHRTLDLAAARRAWAERRARAGRSSASFSISRRAPEVGDTLELRVPDANADNLCSDFAAVGGVVKAVGQHAIIVVDSASPAGGFADADFQAIVNEFDSVIFPVDTLYFGSPLDLDENTMILILYTPEVNKLTPRGASGFVGGFFFGGDLFPRNVCAQSNEGEIFYLLAPDPVGTFGDSRSTSFVRQGTRGTIAHEFQHMINQSVRTRGTGTRFEAVWLNEALSHLAEELVGRRVRGFGEFENLTYSQVIANGADYDAYFRQNLFRFRPWMQRPDTASPTSNRADRSLAVRGAAWAFLRWSADQFAGPTLPPFTRALVVGPDTSISNLVARTGMPYDTLALGWLVSNYTDDLSVPGLSARYQYRGWNMRSVMPAVSGGNYPLLVRTLASGATGGSKLPSGSGMYWRVQRDGILPTTFEFRERNRTAADFTGARLGIVRIE